MTKLAAIVDPHSRDALLAIATQEGLLHAIGPTDGVFEQICSKPVGYRVKEQILEQLVLTPTIVFDQCPEFLWEALGGRLKDEGHVINIADPKPETPPLIETITSVRFEVQ